MNTDETISSEKIEELFDGVAKGNAPAWIQIRTDALKEVVDKAVALRTRAADNHQYLPESNMTPEHCRVCGKSEQEHAKTQNDNLKRA